MTVIDKSVVVLTVQAKWRILLKSETEKITANNGGAQQAMDAAAETTEAFIAAGVATVENVTGVTTWPDAEARNKAVDEYNALVQRRKLEYEKQGFYVVGTEIESGGKRWDDPVHDKLTS